MEIAGQGDMSAKPQYNPASKSNDLIVSDVLTEAPDKIRRSPHAGFYLDAVRAGWSIRKIESHASKVFGESISRDTFARLAALIPQNEKADPTYRQSILKDIDAKIDAINELEALVTLQIRRVTDAALFERQLAAGKGMGVIPLKNTQEEIRLLHDMLKDLANMQVRLGMSSLNMPGLFGGESAESEVLKASPIETKVIELRNALTGEQLDRFISMSEEIQASLYALSVNVVDDHMVGVVEQVRGECM